MEDRSLDEFLDAGADRDRTDESDSVDPAASTSAWDPTGGPCADCGTTAGRRWRGEEGLVCPDCKEW